jgi:hypothetical protein
MSRNPKHATNSIPAPCTLDARKQTHAIAAMAASMERFRPKRSVSRPRYDSGAAAHSVASR